MVSSYLCCPSSRGAVRGEFVELVEVAFAICFTLEYNSTEGAYPDDNGLLRLSKPVTEHLSRSADAVRLKNEVGLSGGSSVAC